MKSQYDPPFLLKQVFPGFQWESKIDKILLSFDDGPVPGITENILMKLNDYHLKVIFFCVGNNILKNSSLASEILNEGHLIGNHTFNHSKLTVPGFDEYAEIDRFNELVKDKLEFDVKYFRPPHGRFNLSTGKLLKNKKLTNVMWSLLTYDFRGNPALVKNSIVRYLKKNSIIVLHDSLRSRDIILDSISFIADEVSAKGFSFGEPAECLK
ncbi:MAG: polysaccharide deacetylase family protein [Ignavibacteriaceae bacterium]|nr:polysaccharide deacetylase family protein [Ignavibacteriaceae bacterium]